MRKEILYIGFYDMPNSHNKRICSSAATDKMNYICSALDRAGYAVHIISPSWFIKADKSYAGQSTVEMGEHQKLTFTPSLGTKRKWARNAKIMLALLWLFFYLIRHARKNEKILVYHTPWLSLPVRWSKWIKRFHLILEVEEVYADVSLLRPCFGPLERKLLDSADSYLFATELLTQKAGKKKSYCIINGSYQAAENLSQPPDDGKIHLLYAGIIDTHKKGAFNAIESTRYLPSNYVLHVIGFGDTDRLCQRIDELNRDNDCKIHFAGTKSGRDYLSFAQSCHIGLSTQSMDGEYLESSFPSKILSYLCMGLRVVSCHIDCVSKSQVHSLVEYYHEDTPQAIAHAIRSIDMEQAFDSRSKIKQLDHNFVKEIAELIDPQVSPAS